MSTAALAERLSGWGLPVDVDGLFGQNLAVFSRCRSYRYVLARSWEPDEPATALVAVWLMLNPSTADAAVDDPTIRRCAVFSRREGAAGMLVLNLFAVRATDPTSMLRHPEPAGEHNDAVLGAAVELLPDALWIAAWGAHGGHLGRATTVRRALAGTVQLHHLGPYTTAGEPGHPLYLPSTAPLEAMAPPAPTPPGRNR